MKAGAVTSGERRKFVSLLVKGSWKQIIKTRKSVVKVDNVSSRDL